MNAYSPIVSEFETPEQEASYERWLRSKVEKSLADQHAPVSHDEVMARTQRIIDEARTRHQG